MIGFVVLISGGIEDRWTIAGEIWWFELRFRWRVAQLDSVPLANYSQNTHLISNQDSGRMVISHTQEQNSSALNLVGQVGLPMSWMVSTEPAPGLRASWQCTEEILRSWTLSQTRMMEI
ncbi:hypothetical protein J5N97_021468 [Dioscorea zingiberensis]|uniref:Uncharacterized protein n=1 Tax=Dioscorea zingiberensis TaxID=325984 RepID=A0A9D5CIE9_9LILI|nr:hypothetical protein J5N97_021468 [Dioscorea zingiberensis]